MDGRVVVVVGGAEGEEVLGLVSGVGREGGEKGRERREEREGKGMRWGIHLCGFRYTFAENFDFYIAEAGVESY